MSNDLFDINRCYYATYAKTDLFIYYRNYHTYDREEFAIVNYQFLSKKEMKIIENNTKRYLLLPIWDIKTRCHQLIEEINNPKVTDFFAKAKNDEDECMRYIEFVDWNGLYKYEEYKCFYIAKDLLIKWCRRYHIKYTWHDIEKLNDYYCQHDISTIDDWILS